MINSHKKPQDFKKEIGTNVQKDAIKSIMKLGQIFQKPTLTGLAKTCGWAAKLSPVGLQNLLDKLKQENNPNVLVGFDTNDDAGV